MPKRRVLVSGASIAGNAVSWWLAQFGFDVLTVERVPGFRDGGQNVDVRGAGRAVLREMDLEAAALALGTGERGTAWIDDRGRCKAKTLVEKGKEGPTAEMEILRGDLARLLYEAAMDCVSYRFGDWITAIDDRGRGAAVTFASGELEVFDLVVVAEGVGSLTRELVFPHENNSRWMDLLCAYFTVQRSEDDDDLWRWYNASGGRSVSLRPDCHGTTRATLTMLRPPSEERYWTEGQQKAFLYRQFDDAGWQTARVLAGMDVAADFYFDILRQVRMPRWSKNRVVLLGDAAWCVTPLGGVGASLALVGACVLAGELARSADTQRALTAYEDAMRPMVTQGQAIPSLAPRLAHPQTKFGIKVLHSALRVLTNPAFAKLASRLFDRDRKEPNLKRYFDEMRQHRRSTSRENEGQRVRTN